jgi:hypothetical protein
MMTGSKVRVTTGHSLKLTTDHYDMDIKMKDILRQTMLKKELSLDRLLFPRYEFSSVNFYHYGYSTLA